MYSGTLHLFHQEPAGPPAAPEVAAPRGPELPRGPAAAPEDSQHFFLQASQGWEMSHLEGIAPIYLADQDGCQFSTSCLVCPLPLCKWDFPGGYRGLKKWLADQQVIQAIANEGLTQVAAADRFGIGVRTVFRIQERNRRVKC